MDLNDINFEQRQDRERLVGCEFEYPIVEENFFPPRRQKVQDMWKTLQSLLPDWPFTLQSPDGDIYGLSRQRDGWHEHISNDTSIGTLEFALRPARSINGLISEHMVQKGKLCDALERNQLRILNMGFQPLGQHSVGLKTKKESYELLGDRIQLHDWSIPMASHQVSVCVTRGKAIEVLNLLNEVSWILAALSTSSPIALGREQLWDEYRLYRAICRSNRLPKSLSEFYSTSPTRKRFGGWREYLSWQSQMKHHLYRRHEYHPLMPIVRSSFEEECCSDVEIMCVNSDGTAMPVAPEIGDFTDLCSYVWTGSRLRFQVSDSTRSHKMSEFSSRSEQLEFVENSVESVYIEVRIPGVSDPFHEGSIAAIVLGLVENLEEAADFVGKTNISDDLFWRSAALGSRVFVEDASLQEFGQNVLHIAKRGLRSRQLDEEHHLEYCFECIAGRPSFGASIRERFRKRGLDGLKDLVAPSLK